MNMYFRAYKIGSRLGSIKLRIVLAFAREGTKISRVCNDFAVLPTRQT
jgi:hypothetical protein